LPRGRAEMGWRLFQIAVFAGFVWLCYRVAADEGSEITRPGMVVFFGVFFAWFLTLFVTIYVELFASLKRRLFRKKHLGHEMLPVSPASEANSDRCRDIAHRVSHKAGSKNQQPCA
jgi:hypothetical protein